MLSNCIGDNCQVEISEKMNIFEEALSDEINNLNTEHDKFLDEFLFEQEYNSISGDTKVPMTAAEYLDSFLTIPSVDYNYANEQKIISPRVSRSAPDKLNPAAIYMERNEKVRMCQNMNGVLGGANAFHFLSFVAGVLTLIVNVNNNINNNNLNINGINANANSNQNSDANVNNNAANVIMVMPGKRKKKRSLHPRNRKNEIESYPGNDTASNCCH